jgi:hypothetical protein
MGEFRQVICPVCGTTHGKENVYFDPVKRKRSEIVDTRNYWERTLRFDPDKPLGQIMSGGGVEPMQLVGTFGPEDDPDGYFFLIKQRLLAAVREWIARGWISLEEAQSVILSGEVPATAIVMEPPAAHRQPQAPTSREEPEETGEDALESLKESLKELLDEEKKALSIKKLEKALAGLDYDKYMGLEDIENAIEDYRSAPRSDKADAFEELFSEIDALELNEDYEE